MLLLPFVVSLSNHERKQLLLSYLKKQIVQPEIENGHLK